MAVVASLDVVLSAVTTRFDRGMKKARQSLTSFASGVKKIAGSVGVALGAGSVALAAVTAFAAGVRSAARDIDRLVDVSSKLGIDVDSLRVLEVAAAQTGVSASQLEMGLQRMTRRMAEAAQGAGEAKAAIKELGLDAKSLTDAGPEAAFFAISQAMSGIESQSDKIRLAFKLFDSEGVNLVRTLGLSAEQFERLRMVSQQSGAEISGRTSKAVKELTAQWSETKLAMAGLANTALTIALPAISTLAAGFNFAVRVTARMLAPLQKVAEVLLPMASRAEEAGDAIADGQEKARAATERATAALERQRRKWREAHEEYKRAVEESANAVAKWRQQLNQTLSEIEGRLSFELLPMEQFEQDVKNLEKLFAAGEITAARRNELQNRSLAVAREKIAEKEAEIRSRAARLELKTVEQRRRIVEEELDRRVAAIRAEARVGIAPAAVEAGTQAAFQSFQRNRKEADAQEKIAAETKQARMILQRLERRAAFLKKAELS